MAPEKSKRNMHDPKSYRVYLSYKLIFESCVDVFGKRTALSDALINRLFNNEDIEERPTYTKAVLVEKMIDSLSESTNDSLNTAHNSKRMKTLKETMHQHNLEWGGVREYVHFRILPAYRDYIKKYPADLIGEVVELAIANFINDCTDFEFKLIEISFSYKIKSIKNQKT